MVNKSPFNASFYFPREYKCFLMLTVTSKETNKNNNKKVKSKLKIKEPVVQALSIWKWCIGSIYNLNTLQAWQNT